MIIIFSTSQATSRRWDSKFSKLENTRNNLSNDIILYEYVGRYIYLVFQSPGILQIYCTGLCNPVILRDYLKVIYYMPKFYDSPANANSPNVIFVR